MKADIDTAFANGANHIAIYLFIDFTFTSIWTFSNENGACYSSMTRDHFLGFGCSATTLLHRQFKINTFSIEEYCRRMDRRELPTSLTLRFSLRQKMVYYLL